MFAIQCIHTLFKGLQYKAKQILRHLEGVGVDVGVLQAVYVRVLQINAVGVLSQQSH